MQQHRINRNAKRFYIKLPQGGVIRTPHPSKPTVLPPSPQGEGFIYYPQKHYAFPLSVLLFLLADAVILTIGTGIVLIGLIGNGADVALCDAHSRCLNFLVGGMDAVL